MQKWKLKCEGMDEKELKKKKNDRENGRRMKSKKNINEWKMNNVIHSIIIGINAQIHLQMLKQSNGIIEQSMETTIIIS